MDLDLDIHHVRDILIFVGGIVLHDLSQGFALDAVHVDGPAVADDGNLVNNGDPQAGGFHAGVSQCFIQGHGFGTAFLEDLDGHIALFVYIDGGAGGNEIFQFHMIPLSGENPFRFTAMIVPFLPKAGWQGFWLYYTTFTAVVKKNIC